MERGFYNDDFEQLIRQKADQYKMFPSEGVWKEFIAHCTRAENGMVLVYCSSSQVSAISHRFS